MDVLHLESLLCWLDSHQHPAVQREFPDAAMGAASLAAILPHPAPIQRLARAGLDSTGVYFHSPWSIRVAVTCQVANKLPLGGCCVLERGTARGTDASTKTRIAHSMIPESLSVSGSCVGQKEFTSMRIADQ